MGWGGPGETEAVLQERLTDCLAWCEQATLSREFSRFRCADCFPLADDLLNGVRCEVEYRRARGVLILFTVGTPSLPPPLFLYYVLRTYYYYFIAASYDDRALPGGQTVVPWPPKEFRWPLTILTRASVDLLQSDGEGDSRLLFTKTEEAVWCVRAKGCLQNRTSYTMNEWVSGTVLSR